MCISCLVSSGSISPGEGLIVTKNKKPCPGWGTRLDGASSSTPKGCRFNSWWGYIPRLWVQSLEGVCTGGNWWMFFTLMSLSLSLLLFLLLLLHLLLVLLLFSLWNQWTGLWMGIKKRIKSFSSHLWSYSSAQNLDPRYWRRTLATVCPTLGSAQPSEHPRACHPAELSREILAGPSRG